MARETLTLWTQTALKGPFYIARKVWRTLWVPWLIITEAFETFIWTPKRVANTSTSEDFSQTVHADRKSAVRQGLDHWWAPNPVSTDILLQRSLAADILRPLIIEIYRADILRRTNPTASRTPLLGAGICNIQCGPGFLSELLVEAGADVTGIDTTNDLIMVARAHFQKCKDKTARPTYLTMSAEELVQQHGLRYDVVVCSQPLNQSIDWRASMRNAGRLVRDGGCIVFLCPNRTAASFLWNIVMLGQLLEYFSTHMFRLYQFLRPRVVAEQAEKNGMDVVSVRGFYPWCWTRRGLKWIFSNYTGFWYAIVLEKPSVDVYNGVKKRVV
ncbi:putative Ubiquinone biosynthesis O-methyltransferase [Hypsibius exemplaris]|uniref:Ubiquinone biosynthesis O-methyltransferase n=1 Tax=Hypsibius exemplaris TaxID=2072580 RepID=A0A1W0WJB8_HYPEX|nr:putative Ubiquinone biosynthesis O-methyltransferase [Hypsibius exemplaris]